MTNTQATTPDLGELKPCRRCGAPCSVQEFPSAGTLWMCSNSIRLKGSCAEDAYYTAESWNTRLSRPVGGDVVERVVLDECTADEIRQAVRDSLNGGWTHNVFARTLGINSAKLSEFLSGKRGAEPGIVEPLGYRWVLVSTDQYILREELLEGHIAALSSIPVSTEPSVDAVERVAEWSYPRPSYATKATFDQLIRWLSDVNEGRWSWTRNPQCKYVDIRIDTRSGAYALKDRDGNELLFDALSALPTASERKCVICGQIIPPFALGPDCQSCFDATEASGEVVQADEASPAALAAYNEANNVYASYMGDPDGNDDTHTAKHEAAKVLDRFALAHSGVGNVVASEGLREVVRQCGAQFRFYETEHLKKGTQDGDEKAYRNKQFADLCRSALSTTEPVELQTDREKGA